MAGLTQWLHHALPKAWLFGLYGAVGGLFGALACGEATWRALRPPPPSVQSVPLRLAVSSSVEVYQGGKHRFAVKIARDRSVGPVRLTAVRSLPAIWIEPVTVPEAQSDLEVDVRADEGAAAGDREILAPRVLQVDGSAFTANLQEAAGMPGAFAAFLPVVSREIARMTLASQPPPPPPTGQRFCIHCDLYS
jgi:hypothetical protein